MYPWINFYNNWLPKSCFRMTPHAKVTNISDKSAQKANQLANTLRVPRQQVIHEQICHCFKTSDIRNVNVVLKTWNKNIYSLNFYPDSLVLWTKLTNNQPKHFLILFNTIILLQLSIMEDWPMKHIFHFQYLTLQL